MIHKIIYILGVRLRSPEIAKRYKFLKETENWSLEELRAYQLQELKRIIKIAYEKSTFYKKLYDAKGIKPNDIKELNDIIKLPIVTKKDLLDYNSQIQNKKGYRRLFYSETSGSTGEPLVLYRNSEWDAGTRAAQLRGYSWYGVNPWERNGYFWGFSFDFNKRVKTKFFDFLLNRFRLFSYRDIEVERFKNKINRATYLEGYSSMIYEMAKKINNSSPKANRYELKMVKGTSEKIYDSYQEDVKKAFGLKMVSEYGSCETGIIAFECPYGNMHIFMENVIIETDENGEIIVTNLLSDSFPIIRYKLGDYVILDQDLKCDCGMHHPIIKEVTGRVGQLIQGFKDYYPSLTLYYIFKNIAIKYKKSVNYQAIQVNKGELIINLEQKCTSELSNIIISESEIYFGNDIKLFINGCSLNRNHEGKFKDFVSYIN